MREVTREREGVRLTLSVDRETYGPSDTVTVKAIVENTNDKPVTYTVRNLGDPGVYLSVLSEISGEHPLRGPDDPEIAQPAISSHTLDAGAKLTREVAWDQELDTYQTPVQAPPGLYTILAESLLGEYVDGREPVSLRAVVTFRLEGSEPIITPQQAIEAAVQIPEVEDWLTNRATNLICTLPNQDIFYAVNIHSGELTETFRLFYDTQVEEGLPICSPVTENGTWRVLFLATEGAPPSRISAFLDINDGTPQGVEEGGPQPTPADGG